MSSTFEAAFMAMLISRVDDENVIITWGQSPKGAPVAGKTDVVIFYAPGGERENTHSGMSGAETRAIQFSVFSLDPQTVHDVAKSLHNAVDGTRGTLADGTTIDNTINTIQDIDSFDSDEQVHQVIFQIDVHISSDNSSFPDLDEPVEDLTKDYIDAGDAATLAAAEAYTDAHGATFDILSGGSF